MRWPIQVKTVMPRMTLLRTRRRRPRSCREESRSDMLDLSDIMIQRQTSTRTRLDVFLVSYHYVCGVWVCIWGGNGYYDCYALRVMVWASYTVPIDAGRIMKMKMSKLPRYHFFITRETPTTPRNPLLHSTPPRIIEFQVWSPSYQQSAPCRTAPHTTSFPAALSATSLRSR